MNKIQANIENLTQLWKRAGESFNGYNFNQGIHSSMIHHSQWPNRVWSTQTATPTDLWKIEMLLNTSNLTYSSFSTINEDKINAADLNLKLKSTQIGMSFVPNRQFDEDNTLVLTTVKNEKQAESWSHVFLSAFKYLISVETILTLKDEIEFILVSNQNEVVATLMIYYSPNTCGLHSLGVPPEHRKKGYAKNIMKTVLNRMHHENIPLVTLQASDMAKNMYLSLGFQEDFIMDNYIHI